MKKFLEKIHLPAWLIGILALVFVLRIPSFFEPYYYGDETVYMSLGQGIRQGITLYSGIYDNKPPLLYLTAAAAGNLFWFKAMLAFWMLLTTVFFYKLAKRLFEKHETTQKVATLIFALATTLPTFEGNTVNAELFMIGFSILAFLILLGNKLTPKKLFLAGFLFGLGTLFKVPAAFDIPVIIVYWIIADGFKNWRKIFKNTLVLGLGFLSPIILTILWSFTKGIAGEYLKSAFLQNIGYLSSFRPQDVQKPFLVKNGPLLLRALMVFLGSGILFAFRKRLSKNYILLTVWVFFALFAITLSERPYPHYFVQALAPLSLLVGIFFAEKSLEQSLVVLPLALSFFVPFHYKFYDYPILPYYARFINFASGKIDKRTYFSEFSPQTNRNYQLADFLITSSLPAEKVFMWDPDSAAVYSLSQRLPPVKWVVPYHVHDFSSTKAVARDLIKNPPKFIILTSDKPYPEIQGLLQQKYLLIEQIENANVYSRTGVQ